MNAIVAMLLGALIGLSMIAWSLDTLVPQETRAAVRARNLEARASR